MTLKLVAPFGLALLFAAPAPAQEPEESLTEAAAKEKDRRKATPNARAFTESDLAKARKPGDDLAAPETAASPSPSPSPGGKREKTEEELRAEKRAGYEKRIAEKVAVLEVVRKAMADAQLELNDMTTLTQFGSRKDALQKILDDGAVELKKGDEAIAAIEEEARREGIQISRP